MQDSWVRKSLDVTVLAVQMFKITPLLLLIITSYVVSRPIAYSAYASDLEEEEIESTTSSSSSTKNTFTTSTTRRPQSSYVRKQTKPEAAKEEMDQDKVTSDPIHSKDSIFSDPEEEDIAQIVYNATHVAGEKAHALLTTLLDKWSDMTMTNKIGLIELLLAIAIIMWAIGTVCLIGARTGKHLVNKKRQSRSEVLSEPSTSSTQPTTSASGPEPQQIVFHFCNQHCHQMSPPTGMVRFDLPASSGSSGGSAYKMNRNQDEDRRRNNGTRPKDTNVHAVPRPSGLRRTTTTYFDNNFTNSGNDHISIDPAEEAVSFHRRVETPPLNTDNSSTFPPSPGGSGFYMEMNNRGGGAIRNEEEDRQAAIASLQAAINSLP